MQLLHGLAHLTMHRQDLIKTTWLITTAATYQLTFELIYTILVAKHNDDQTLLMLQLQTFDIDLKVDEIEADNNRDNICSYSIVLYKNIHLHSLFHLVIISNSKLRNFY